MKLRTLQQTFDFVATHLFTQGVRALDDKGMCLYRASDGTSCAVGCLIPDEMYTQKMERMAVGALLADKSLSLKTLGVRESETAPALLEELQVVHDAKWYAGPHYHDHRKNWDTSEIMHAALAIVAQKFRLTTDNIKHLKFSDR